MLGSQGRAKDPILGSGCGRKDLSLQDGVCRTCVALKEQLAEQCLVTKICPGLLSIDVVPIPITVQSLPSANSPRFMFAQNPAKPRRESILRDQEYIDYTQNGTFLPSVHIHLAC